MSAEVTEAEYLRPYEWHCNHCGEPAGELVPKKPALPCVCCGGREFRAFGIRAASYYSLPDKGEK